jgi:preprotein translocase subunit SecY
MKFKIIVLFALSFLFSLGVSAQCAMCRASVENNVSNGDTSIGAGLNNGILYLVVMPYLMAGIIGYLWYRASKKKKARLQAR